MNLKVVLRLSPLLLLIPLLVNCAAAPPKHPYYLHAISDLRSARWLIEHRPADVAVSEQETVAISEIDAAIAEIRRAAIDEGKDVHKFVEADAPKDYRGRLHQALDLLHKVHSDVAREEDDPNIRGLRNRAIEHIDGATSATERAIHDVDIGR